MKNEESLLARYMSNKIKEFSSSERPRNHKGDYIGCSAARYAASLLALLNINHKAVAQQVGVRWGTVRQWHTDADFREMLREHVEEFAGRVVEAIRTGEGVKTPSLFADTRHWNQALKAHMSRQIGMILEAPANEEEFFSALDVYEYLRQAWGLEPLLRFSEEDRKAAARTIIEIVEKGLVEQTEDTLRSAQKALAILGDAGPSGE